MDFPIKPVILKNENLASAIYVFPLLFRTKAMSVPIHSINGKQLYRVELPALKIMIHSFRQFPP